MKLIIAEKKELAEAIVAAIPGEKNIMEVLLLQETIQLVGYMVTF